MAEAAATTAAAPAAGFTASAKHEARMARLASLKQRRRCLETVDSNAVSADTAVAAAADVDSTPASAAPAAQPVAAEASSKRGLNPYAAEFVMPSYPSC